MKKNSESKSCQGSRRFLIGHNSRKPQNSHLNPVLRFHVAIQWDEGAEMQQGQVHSGAAVLRVGPAFSGSSYRWGWRGEIRVREEGTIGVVVTIGSRAVRAVGEAGTVAGDQEGPPVVAVVQDTNSSQQQQNEGAEQEKHHVDSFSQLCRQPSATT